MKNAVRILAPPDPFIPDRRTRVVVFAVVALLLAGVLFDARMRLRSSHADWFAYWSAAERFAKGGDPYAVSGPTPDYYIYPPLFALSLRPLAAMRVEDAIVVWDALSVLMLLGCYFEWRRIYVAMRAEPAPRWLFMVVVFVMALPVVSTLQGGQVNILNLYMTLLGMRLVFLSDGIGSWIAAGLALALPAAIKLSPGLVGAVAVVQLLAARPGGGVVDARRRGAVLAMSLVAGAALWFLVVPALITGWHRNLELLTMFYDHIIMSSRRNMNAFSATNQSIVHVVTQYAAVAHDRLGIAISSKAIAATTVAAALAFGVPVALAMRRLVRRGTLLEHVVVCGLATAAAVFYSPVSWHHHYTLTLPFIASAPLWLIDSGRDDAARWLTCGFVLAVVLQYLLSMLRLNALPTLGPCFAACVVAFALVVLRDDRARQSA